VYACFVAADAQSDLGVQLEFKNLTLVSPREHASLLRALPSGKELRYCVITTFQSFKHCFQATQANLIRPDPTANYNSRAL
jgi:hypothetical protein